MKKGFIRIDFENLKEGDLISDSIISEGLRVKVYAGKNTAHVIEQANKKMSEICLRKAAELLE